MEKLSSMLMNRSSSRSGSIAPDIMLIPYMRTANPSMIPPIFLLVVFFANIQRAIPPSATMPVSIVVFRYLVTLAPDPPRLFRHRIQPVILVPRMAPRTTPIACRTFIMPELTKPTTMTDVADDDWITAVTPVPRRIPLIVLPDSLYRIISILLPATFFSESPMTDMPNRNIATPPKSDTILLASIHFPLLFTFFRC